MSLHQQELANLQILDQQRLLLKRLIANDQAYFRAGATCEPRDGYTLYYLPGLAHTAAGCMIEASKLEKTTLNALHVDLKRIGGKYVRIYRHGEVHDPILDAFGFERSEEVVLTGDARANQRALPRHITIEPATPDDDLTKVSFYAEDTTRPDGKMSNAETYVALERRKISAGYMEGFIVRYDDEPIGCFSLARRDGVVRMKNLMIRASARGKGGGQAIVRYAHQYAMQIGCSHVGVFAVTGSKGQKLYQREGMHTLGIVTEHHTTLENLTNVLASRRSH